MGGLDYWSTVPTFGGGGYAWSLAFVDGTAYYYASINSWPVRCVRGGSSSGTGTGARFAAQDSGATVLDRISGLHWQQGFSAAVMTQTAGLSWCTANTPALPGSGWRLPTSHELEDLVDTQAWSPVTDVVFADAVGDSFWSATLSVLGGEACHVQLGGGGGSHFSLTTSTQRARCVR